MRRNEAIFAVVGDTHGHLQLALCVAARWQQELGVHFEGVLLCGDVGTFTLEDPVDGATRWHARSNPCELEFLTQWSVTPQPTWLQFIFTDEEQGGLGLACPILMVHGNHEGFGHLRRLLPGRIPGEPVEIGDLPVVDSAGHIRLIPPGWRVVSASGHLIAGIGGIGRGQRAAAYDGSAYHCDEAVLHLCEQPPVDILITHQGPSSTQGVCGSETLQMLLEPPRCRVWLHGHDAVNPLPQMVGAEQTCWVVPLGDIAFPARGLCKDDPGADGWALLTIDDRGTTARKLTPPFLREFRRHRWVETAAGLLVCPALSKHVDGVENLRGRAR